jgi:group I intron endonuclease
MQGIIYALICPITRKVKYVGLTKKDPNKRLSAHITETKNYIKNNKFLNKKHTWLRKLISMELDSEIEIEILEKCKYDMLGDREKYWISYFKSTGITNSTDGGDGVLNLSQDAKDRISFANSGEKNGMYGKRISRSQDQKDKLSNSLLNSEKLKESRNSKEYKEKISNAFSIPILVLDENYNIIFEFKNCRECAEYFNYTNGNIANAIRYKRQIGKRRGYKYWIVRKEDFTQNENIQI